MSMSVIAIVMFLAACGVLMLGYPVAFTLAGVALIFALLGLGLGAFGVPELLDLPSRLYGVMNNETLMAVPLFVLMGVVLERARIAEDLLESMASALGRLHGGMLVAVVLVGGLMAASTGIVGATVVTLGLLSLPTLLKRGYDPSLATGTIAASGTLGQIIPPSTLLIILADVMSTSFQQAQYEQGKFSVEALSVGQFFAAAVIPGLVAAWLFMFALVATIDRNLGLGDALRTSFETAKNNAGNSFLVWLLTWLIMGICILVTLPFGLLVIVYTWRRLSGGQVAPLTP